MNFLQIKSFYANPLISIVLPTKNSLPHLKRAIQGIRNQTYRNFELIIQDGGSTDGTLEYLATIQDLPKIDIQSSPDTGIGQAYNRGIIRSQGDFLFLAASDEFLFSDTLMQLVSLVNAYPFAAVITGGVSLVDSKGKMISKFTPSSFDFLKIIKCEIVLSAAASLLNKQIIGQDLFYDESLKTCPDYDFWLRIGNRFSPNEIICRHEIFLSAIADRTSMSYRAEAFEQFCRDKLFILNRFMTLEATKPYSRLKEYTQDLSTLESQAKAGILTWAAKEVLSLEGVSARSQKLCEEAENFSKNVDHPTHPIRSLSMNLKVSYQHRFQRWIPYIKKLSIPFQLPKHLKGGFFKWGYIATAHPVSSSPNNMKNWVKIRMQVTAGAIGVCFMHKGQLQKEKIFPASSKEVTTYYPFHTPEDFSIIFRNGGLKKSNVKIYELSVVHSNPVTE